MGEVDYVYPEIAKIPGMDKLLGIVESKNKQGKISYRTSKPEVLHFLNSFLARLYTTTGKLSNEDMSTIAKLLYSLFGVKARGVDIEREKYYREVERERQINETLEKMEVLRKFEKYYQPKK